MTEADTLTGALGSAVIRNWSALPADIQHDLFEAAVAAAGEAMRQDLAVFLHHGHERTRGSDDMAADAH